MAWVITTKLEMTRVLLGDKFVPVTLLKVPTLKVVEVKTNDSHGYDAIVVGVLIEGKEGTAKDGNKTLSKNEFETIREFPLSDDQIGKFNVGDTLTLDMLDEVKFVRVEGNTKGRWFTGAMKKWNFSGGPGGHGSKFHRALGSIGTRKPRRTHKGKKMHGHWGNERVSIKNVPLELVNKDISVIGVRGGVPGGRNSIVHIIF